MADNNKINIDIKNAIHQQASAQNNAKQQPGLQNPMSKQTNQQPQSGVKDIISNFADVKKILSQAIQNSKNTFTKIEKNVNTLIDIEKQNSKGINSLNEQMKLVQKNSQPIESANIVQYDQKAFIQHLKTFFEQINTKLLLIKQDLNNNNNNQQGIDLSAIEMSINSSSNAITQKLDQMISSSKSEIFIQPIIQSLKAISEKIPENTNNNTQLLIELQSIKNILDANGLQTQIITKLDELISSINQNSNQQNLVTQNNISKEQINGYFEQIISALQKKNQNLSYSTVIDITNLQNSFTIFLQNLKNQNSALAEQIISQQLKITAAGSLSQTSAYDVQTLNTLQEKLVTIQASLQQFKNSYEIDNQLNNQINQNNISISMALTKLDNSSYVPPQLDIDKLVNELSNTMQNQNEQSQSNVSQKDETPQQDDKQQASTQKNIIKSVQKTVVKKQNNDVAMAGFGETLKNQFFNLLSNIGIISQTENNGQQTEEKETDQNTTQNNQPNQAEQTNQADAQQNAQNQLGDNDDALEIQTNDSKQNDDLQIQANVLNNLQPQYANNDLLAQQEEQPESQPNFDMLEPNNKMSDAEAETNVILANIENDVNQIKESLNENNNIVIAIHSSDNSKIAQAISQIDTLSKNQSLNIAANMQKQEAKSQPNTQSTAVPVVNVNVTNLNNEKASQTVIEKNNVKTESPQKKSEQQKQPMQNIVQSLFTTMFGEDIMVRNGQQAESNSNSNKNSSSNGFNPLAQISNSTFGGLFNRKQLSEQKQAAVQQISTKQQQISQMTKQSGNVQLELAEIDGQVQMASSNMQNFLDNLDDNQEYRQLLDNSEFLQLCKSTNLEDINEALQMCQEQFQRLNTLKQSAKDKTSIVLEQKNINQVKKQLAVQKNNLEKQQKHKAKAKELQNRIKQTQISINKIKTNANLTQDQIKIGLQNKDNPMNNIMGMVMQAFAQMLGISTGNSNPIALSPENITEKLKQPEQSQQQLINNAFRKYTSVKSGNPIVDNYLNNYVKKRFDDINLNNPDMSKQEIDQVGNSLIKQFETAWDKGYVLIPSEDGSTFIQMEKQKVQNMQSGTQALTIEDISIAEQIDALDQPQADTTEQSTTNIDVNAQNTQKQSAGQNTLQSQPSDTVYFNQNQYDQDMNTFMQETFIYEQQKAQNQQAFEQWKSSGSDEMTQLLAQTKNNYVIHQINKLAETGPIPPQQQQKLIQSYQKTWDNNLDNNVVIYTQDNQIFKSDKDDFLKHYFDNNIIQAMPQPTPPKQADYIVANPSKQEIDELKLQPYTQRSENNEMLDAEGQVVQPPPAEDSLPDTIQDLQKQLLKEKQNTEQKKDQKLQSTPNVILPNENAAANTRKAPQETPQKKQESTIGSVLANGGNVAEAYRKQQESKNQKTLQNNIADNMLQGYSKMLGIDVKQLSQIFGSEPPTGGNKEGQSLITNISNSVTDAGKNIVNQGASFVNNTKNQITNSAKTLLDSNNVTVTGASTNPETKGSDTVKKLVESDKQKNKQEKAQKQASADSLQNIISSFTSTIVNNNNTTTDKEDNSDKLLQGIATLVEASKPQVIYVWPSEKNDPPKINTIINI